MQLTSWWLTSSNQTYDSPPKLSTQLRRNSKQNQEYVVKLAQYHRLAPGALPHYVLDKILNHTLSVARKRNMVSFMNTLQFTLIPLGQTPTCWNFTNFCRYQSISTSRQMFKSPWTWGRTTCWPLVTQNLFKLSPALICIHASTSETPSFAREGK
jgi:hypothetical protein